MSATAADSKTSYFLDKLQSLSGVIPIGAFLLEHFWSNSYALVSVQKYNDVSVELQSIPWRIIVEACVLWLPILFHGFYGLYIWWMGKSNAIGHPWMANWLWVLQRWTGIIALIFIFWHVYLERFVGHGRTNYQDLADAMSHPGYFAFYIAGITAATTFAAGDFLAANCTSIASGSWNVASTWTNCRGGIPLAGDNATIASPNRQQ